MTVIVHGWNGSVQNFEDHGMAIKDRIIADDNNAKVKVLRYNKPEKKFDVVFINGLSGIEDNGADNEDVHTILIWDWNPISFLYGEAASRTSVNALLAHLLMGNRDNWWDFFHNQQSDVNKLHFIGHSRGCAILSELTEMLIKGENDAKWILPEDMHVTYLDPHDWGANGAFWSDMELNLETPNYPSDYQSMPGCGGNKETPLTVNLQNSGIEGWNRTHGDIYFETYYEDIDEVFQGIGVKGRRVRGTFCKYLRKTGQYSSCNYPTGPLHESPNMGHSNLHVEWYRSTITNPSLNAGFNFSYLGGNYENNGNKRQDAIANGYYSHLSLDNNGDPLTGMYGTKQNVKFDFAKHGFVNYFSGLFLNYVGWHFYNGPEESSIWSPVESNKALIYPEDGDLIIEDPFAVRSFRFFKENYVMHDFVYIPPGMNFLKVDYRSSTQNNGNLTLYIDEHVNGNTNWQLLHPNNFTTSSININQSEPERWRTHLFDVKHLRDKIVRLGFHKTGGSSNETVDITNLRYEECPITPECLVSTLDMSGSSGIMGPTFVCVSEANVNCTFTTTANQSGVIRGNTIRVSPGCRIQDGTAISFSTNTINCAIYDCSNPFTEEEPDAMTNTTDTVVDEKNKVDKVLEKMESQKDMKAKTSLTLSPNPNHGQFRLSYHIPTDDFVSLYLYDMSGKLLETFEKDVKSPPGEYSKEFDITNYKDGMYMIILESSKHKSSLKFVKM